MTVPAILRGRPGALLVLGLAAGIIVLIIGVPVFAAFNAQADDIHQSRAELAVYQAEQMQQKSLQARLAALKQNAETVPGLLSGGSAALAQAQLQSGMRDLIRHNGGALLSAQLLPPAVTSGFDVVSISYELTVPLSRIRGLVYAVETHTPFYFISDANFVMPANWSPGDPQAPDPNMEIRWTIRAYRWNGRR